MLVVKKYNPENKLSWNEFIKNSKNGTFLLDRNFMDYHSDRFIDFSLMFYENEELLAVFPASLHENEIRSHGGLTYGGIITNQNMKQHKMNDCFLLLRDYLKEQNVRKVVYKRIPYIYYTYPADEDLYALFLNDAKLMKRDVATVVNLKRLIKLPKGRKAQIMRSKREGIVVKEAFDFDGFINLENKTLQKYGVKAVHTAEELIFLKLSFNENIRLFVSDVNGDILAAILIFEMDKTVHLQYIASSEEGRKIGALDLLISTLIEKYKETKEYFDFGISTENNGRFLNEGLCAQKEGFGGRSVCYDSYELEVN